LKTTLQFPKNERKEEEKKTPEPKALQKKEFCSSFDHFNINGNYSTANVFALRIWNRCFHLDNKYKNFLLRNSRRSAGKKRPSNFTKL
jgi:hypothetical protein